MALSALLSVDATTLCAPRLMASACFAQRGGEGGDLANPGVEEAQRQMPEAADADHADAVGGLDAELQQWAEHRGAGTEQRPTSAGSSPRRQRNGPGPVRAQAIGEAAVAADDGRFHRATEVVRAFHARAAMHAAALVPADADALAELEAARLLADADDGADYLVARDEGIAGVAPLVVDHRLVGMADAAVLHGHLDLPRRPAGQDRNCGVRAARPVQWQPSR